MQTSFVMAQNSMMRAAVVLTTEKSYVNFSIIFVHSHLIILRKFN